MMRSKFLSALLVLFLFICEAAFAQKLFEPGFIVLNSKDTVRGAVQSGQGKMFVRCIFKKGAAAQPVKYGPAEILAYGFENGKRFESLKADSSVLFVEQILTGKASLLYNGKEYYLRKDGALHKLVGPYELATNTPLPTNRRYSTLQHPYRATLKALMADCPSAEGWIKYTTYGYGSLSAVVKKYNTCMNSVTTEFDKRPLLQVNIRAGAGFTQSSFILNKVYFPTYGNGSFEKSKQITAGAGFEFSSPRTLAALKFTIDALYIKNSFHGRAEVHSSGTIYYYEYFAKVTSLKVPIGFRYYFLNMNPNLYFGAGYNMELLSHTSASSTREAEGQGTVYSYDNGELSKYRGMMGGYFLTVGASKKLWKGLGVWVEVRVERMNGYFGPGATHLSDAHALTVLAGIKI